MIANDEGIAIAISEFSNGVLEIKRLKLQVSKEIIESEKQGRQMLIQGQLQMAALFAEAFKGKGSP